MEAKECGVNLKDFKKRERMKLQINYCFKKLFKIYIEE
jgi:hypothetical protein